MPPTQTLKVQLKPCCLTSLDNIRDTIDAGKLLSGIVGASPLITMLGSHNAVRTFTVVTTDWKQVFDAMKVVERAAAYSCYTTCVSEALQHPGGDLHKFWRALAEAFNKARLS